MKSIKPKKNKAATEERSIDRTHEVVTLLAGAPSTLEPAGFSQTPIMPTAKSIRYTKEIVDLLAGNNRNKIDEEEDLSIEHNNSKKNNGLNLDIDRLIEDSQPVSLLSGASATLGLSEEEELAMAIQESIKFNGEKENYPNVSGYQSGFFYSAKEEKEKEKEEANTSVYSSRFWSPELTKSNGLPYYQTDEEELERALLASLEEMPRNNSNC